MSEKLNYRLFEKADIAGVLRLWEEESGWGGITKEQFYKWYVNTPFGECLTVLAVDENSRIIGQSVLVPARIYVAGEQKKAMRVLAPIIAKDYRNDFRRSEHPFFEMYKLGSQTAIAQGVSIFYTFPAHTWLPVLRIFPQVGLHSVETDEFDCYSLSVKSLTNSSLMLGDDIKISLINEFNEDFDELWNLAIVNFPIRCGIIRGADWLNWKLGGRWTFAIRNLQTELIGYASIDKKTSLLTDALARTPEDLERTIGVLINFLNDSNELKIDEIKLMKTNFMQSIIEKFSFTKIDFKFAFGCYAVDKDISADSITPNHWYMMPND